jgi:hypothetical protein
LAKQETNLLDLIPETNCRWDRADDGRIYLLVPRFKNKIMRHIGLRLGRSEWVKIFLDEIGTRSWDLIDGSRTVAEIGETLEREMGEKVNPVYERLAEFMVILHRNRFVILRNRE